MEATVAERGQITLPKAVRDALGLTKGTQLKVELDGGRIILRKNVDDALSAARQIQAARRRELRRRHARAARAGARRSVSAADRRAGEAGSPQVIAVDSSVVVDLLGSDARADAAEEALRRALSLGPVVVCDVVVAEVVAGLGFGSDFVETLEDAGILFSSTELRAAVRAGEMQRRYKQRARAEGRGAAAQRAVPDFLIGAHALLQCSALITRDEGFFRDYFKGLRVIVPRPAQ